MKRLSINHTIQKAQERAYTEKAAKLLNAQWIPKNIEEPLNFEIHQEQEKFGLEIKQVFSDLENKSGSPSGKAPEHYSPFGRRRLLQLRETYHCRRLDSQ